MKLVIVTCRSCIYWDVWAKCEVSILTTVKKILTATTGSLFKKQEFIRPLLAKKKMGLGAWSLNQQHGYIGKNVSLVLEFCKPFYPSSGGKEGGKPFCKYLH